MEKISRILPASPRLKAVDVSRSQPVRPGAPSWGRPVGRVTSMAASVPVEPVDRVSLSAADQLKKTPIYNQRAEMSRAQVVENLAKKFFETNPKADVREGDMTRSEEILHVMDEAREAAPVRESTPEAPAVANGAPITPEK